MGVEMRGCLEGQARELIHEAVSERASPWLDKGMRALASVDQPCLGGSSGEKEGGWGLQWFFPQTEPFKRLFFCSSCGILPPINAQMGFR